MRKLITISLTALLVFSLSLALYASNDKKGRNARIFDLSNYTNDKGEITKDLKNFLEGRNCINCDHKDLSLIEAVSETEAERLIIVTPDSFPGKKYKKVTENDNVLVFVDPIHVVG